MAGEPILIVDDTPVNLKLTRILLVNEGYKVMTAASAEEALELLRSYHPQLILADIQVPGIDGLELTRRIKKNEETRDITVVALTAFAMKGDEQKAVEAGCDGYITKPIDTRSLGARLREHLDRRLEAPRPSAAGAPADAADGTLPAAEMLALRRRFLMEGQEAAPRRRGRYRQYLRGDGCLAEEVLGVVSSRCCTAAGRASPSRSGSACRCRMRNPATARPPARRVQRR